MRKYHMKGKKSLSGYALSLVLAVSVECARIPATIGTAIPPLCSPEFLKGAGIMGSMGINGLGGLGQGYGFNASTLCLKGVANGLGNIGLATKIKEITPAMRQAGNLQAIRALLNLQEAECKTGKVNPKTQACFLYKSIARKAKNPINSVSTTGNTLVISSKGRTVAMLVVERFGKLSPKKKIEPTAERLMGPNKYKVVFNEFDDILKKEGRLETRQKRGRCAECLNSLKTSLVVGDVECECEDSVTLNLDDFKGETSKYSELAVGA